MYEKYFVTPSPYPVVMLPTFMHKRRRFRRHEHAQPGSGDRVRLIECSYEMIGLLGRIGTIEGTDGEEVLVRFGEIVVQVPPEWVEVVEL